MTILAERDAARAYWAGRSVRTFARERPWSAELSRRIVERQPRRVLEFGCAVGRHLRQVHQLDPSIALTGVDINERAIAVADATVAATFHVGDEDWLAQLPPDGFDLAFTVSVLDHIPDPQPAVEALAALAPVLVLVEPWSGSEGRIERDPDHRPANPFLYSWDYPARLPAWGWSVESFPLTGWRRGVGPWYRLYVGERPS